MINKNPFDDMPVCRATVFRSVEDVIKEYIIKKIGSGYGFHKTRKQKAIEKHIAKIVKIIHCVDTGIEITPRQWKSAVADAYVIDCCLDLFILPEFSSKYLGAAIYFKATWK
jgi:hypothetical protein